MVRRTISVAVAVIALVASATAVQAHVGVDIGIHLPGPPSLVVIPQTPVAYAPAVPANLFFYGGQYYVFTHNVWYTGPTYHGPWAVIAPAYVPPPILGVPVRYYRVAPPGWKHWRREAPPRWAAAYRHDAKAYRNVAKAEEKAERKAHKEFEKEGHKEKHKH